IPNVTIYSKNNLIFRAFNFILKKLKVNFSIINLIAKKCDGIIQIGGSIFMQSKKWHGKNKLEPLVKDKPYFVLGANFGPYKEESFYLAHYDLFKEYTDICFRD